MRRAEEEAQGSRGGQEDVGTEVTRGGRKGMPFLDSGPQSPRPLRRALRLGREDLRRTGRKHASPSGRWEGQGVLGSLLTGPPSPVTFHRHRPGGGQLRSHSRSFPPWPLGSRSWPSSRSHSDVTGDHRWRISHRPERLGRRVASFTASLGQFAKWARELPMHK